AALATPTGDCAGAGPQAREERLAAGRARHHRRLAHRGERHQPDLLPRDPGPERLRRRRDLRHRSRSQTPMIGVLLVTHGEIGTALLASASQILGGAPQQVTTLSVWRHDDPDDLVLRARELLEQIDAGDGVLALTDIFGATPGNVVSRLLADGQVEGVSGVSLPMLLRVLTSRDGSLGAAVKRALSGGAEGVVHMDSDRFLDA